MFTLKIDFLTATNKFSKFYCKKYKKAFVLSDYKGCARLFKTIPSAKRSMTLFIKGRGSFNNVIGYSIDKYLGE